ncbi:MAG TPA: nucleotidyltransferase family protein [Candidatus Obscuribacterales bacterium]
MNEWIQTVISPDSNIRSAVNIIDNAPSHLALVFEDDRLCGTVCDIDVRKGLLAGLLMDDPVSLILDRNPLLATGDEPEEVVKERARLARVDAVPRVDAAGRVLSVVISDREFTWRDNWVVLMAGGRGERLRPLTESLPKPLLEVQGKPLLESTLENLITFGFKRVFLAVNYKAEMVKRYFGNGSAWGIDISYLEEEEPLGTAGAVGLLEEQPVAPLLIMNGDVLTRVNFDQLLSFHQRLGSIATMCVRMYTYQIPYGVVDVVGTDILKLREKPITSLCVNAGIYVLDRPALDLIDKGAHLDMPTLFGRLIEASKKVCAFPVRERWIDIGDITEYERAQEESDCETFVPRANAVQKVFD